MLQKFSLGFNYWVIENLVVTTSHPNHKPDLLAEDFGFNDLEATKKMALIPHSTQEPAIWIHVFKHIVRTASS